MKPKSQGIFEVNEDLITLLSLSHEIGWKDLRESSIHRIIYLSSVLYHFMHEFNTDIYKNYHFSLSSNGPYSKIISNSLLDLKRREIIEETNSGVIELHDSLSFKDLNNSKIEWFKTVIFILGLYGENRIFSFVINDPQYKNYFQRNSVETIDISDHNKTVIALKAFQKKFENTLNNTSNISDKEYLELYFEFIFSKIIKKEL